MVHDCSVGLSWWKRELKQTKFNIDMHEKYWKQKPNPKAVG
jgi:hypothetical protein